MWIIALLTVLALLLMLTIAVTLAIRARNMQI